MWRSYLRSFLLFLLVLPACSRQPAYPEAPRSGQDIAIDIRRVQPGIPLYYSYTYREAKISFFVVKLDGRLISFLDACVKCYPKKRGFGYDSGYVVCRACNERYPISGIEKGFGSCYPIRLEGRTKDGRYMISTAELEKSGGRFFR